MMVVRCERPRSSVLAMKQPAGWMRDTLYLLVYQPQVCRMKENFNQDLNRVLGGSRQLHTSSAQPGPSRLANATSSATSISAAPRSQPPKFTSRPSKLSGNSKSSTKPPRPRYEQLSIFAKEGTTSKKKTQARTSQSATSSAIKPRQLWIASFHLLLNVFF